MSIGEIKAPNISLVTNEHVFLFSKEKAQISLSQNEGFFSLHWVIVNCIMLHHWYTGIIEWPKVQVREDQHVWCCWASIRIFFTQAYVNYA